MKIKIEIDCTPHEFQELFIPSDRQQEFVEATYDAYVDALQKMMWKQIDPYNYIKTKDDK
jgi:hypothetical protein